MDRLERWASDGEVGWAGAEGAVRAEGIQRALRRETVGALLSLDERNGGEEK